MSALATLAPLTQLPVEHLMDLSVDLEPRQVIPTPLGLRITYIVRHGSFEGPRLRGELLPGGGDWLVFGDDGLGRVDVRATMRADDGALIHLTTLGVVDLPPDGPERLAAGERLDFDELHARTTLRFETGAPQHSWLNRAVTVAVNELGPDHVDYRVYRVL